MKALIIDDEEHVIVAVKLLVDWKKHHINTVYEVTSPESVLPLIRMEKPEIVISDVKMPGITGLELITKILEICPKTKIIMISGFGQFEFVRSALQHGCVDYILKPIDEVQINAAVKKAVLEHQRDSALELIEHSYQEIHSEFAKTRAQKLLLLYYSSSQTKMVFSQLCEIMPAFQSIEKCRIGIIYTNHLPAESFQGIYDSAALTSIINDMVFATGKAVAIMRQLNSNIILFFDASLECIPRLCIQVLECLYAKSGIKLHMGLSHAAKFPEQFEEANLEAINLAEAYNLLANTESLHQHKMKGQEDFTFNMLAFEDQLFSAVLNGYPSAICASVKICVKAIFAASYLSIRHLEQIKASYNSIRLRWIESIRMNFPQPQGEAVLYPQDSKFLLPFNRHGEFSRELLEELLVEDLTEVSSFFSKLTGRTGAEDNLFHQIEQYIILNYNSKISLEIIAEQFSISQNYLSRAFKKNIGEGITDYINNLRIDKAKELLRNPTVRIFDVASQVGYSDEKYFSRVFKKNEGISPLQYRLTHAQK